MDDITALYFQTFHHHIPIVCRPRFQNNLIASRVGPRADIAVLLLSISLITSLQSPNVTSADQGSPMTNRQSLYLATKALLAQVQGSSAPSIHSIQANLLLAIFEYAGGRPDTAFITVTGCARMAYAARLHDLNHLGMDSAIPLELQEARNTWWGVVTYER